MEVDFTQTEPALNAVAYKSDFHALMSNKHLAHTQVGLNAPAVSMVSITIGELVNLLKTTPTNNPHYMTLVKIAEAEGLLNTQALNGIFSSIGNFIGRNVSSALKDTGKIVGKVVQIAAPIVSGITGIPISSISGIVGKFGDMIGGDIGNSFSAMANGGESTRAMNDRLNREQQAANAQAQAQYDAQVKAQQEQQAQQEQALRNQIGYKPNYVQPNFNMPYTTGQINTLAQIKNVSPEVVKEEIANSKEIAKSSGFKFTTPIIVGGGIGIIVLGVAIYAIAKK